MHTILVLALVSAQASALSGQRCTCVRFYEIMGAMYIEYSGFIQPPSGHISLLFASSIYDLHYCTISTIRSDFLSVTCDMSTGSRKIRSTACRYASQRTFGTREVSHNLDVTFLGVRDVTERKICSIGRGTVRHQELVVEMVQYFKS